VFGTAKTKGNQTQDNRDATTFQGVRQNGQLKTGQLLKAILRLFFIFVAVCSKENN
jgi:hypothetical protein